MGIRAFCPSNSATEIQAGGFMRRFCYLTIASTVFVITCVSRGASEPVQANASAASNTAAGHYEAGKAAFMKLKFDVAFREAEEALKLDRDLGDAHRLRGAVLVEWNRQDEALVEYEEAIRINPRDSWAHYNVGVLCKNRGDYVCAISAYTRAIEIMPSAAAHNNRGWFWQLIRPTSMAT
jgi:tetratricopeptide (TPR) repeat protein